jgi:hypothetical protein
MLRANRLAEGEELGSNVLQVRPRNRAHSHAMQRRTLCRGHATLALAYAISMEMRALGAALSIANGEANGGRFLMKLPAPHKPPGNIGGL